MKGIILIKDPGIAKFVSELFPEWTIVSSNSGEKAVEFYPFPEKNK